MNRKYFLNTERYRKNSENDTKRQETRCKKTKQRLMVISSGGAGLKGKRLNSTNDNTPVLEIFSIRSKYFQSISNVPIASIGRTYLPFFVSTSTFCSFSCRLGNVFTTRPWSHFDLSLLPSRTITRSPIWTFFDP